MKLQIFNRKKCTSLRFCNDTNIEVKSYSIKIRPISIQLSQAFQNILKRQAGYH